MKYYLHSFLIISLIVSIFGCNQKKKPLLQNRGECLSEIFDSVFDDNNQLGHVLITEKNSQQDLIYYDYIGKFYNARLVKTNEIVFISNEDCFSTYLKNNIIINYQDCINYKVLGELIFSKDEIFEVRFFKTPFIKSQKDYCKKEILRLIEKSKKQWLINNVNNDTLLLSPFSVYFP